MLFPEIPGALTKHPSNPILVPRGDGWEASSVFNPAAWTDGKQVYMLYRAEGPCDFAGRAFASCIGLAISDDGIHFEREHTPVLEPTEPYEMPGGCEDPRIVRIDGLFYMTYTAFDGKTARLAMAVSEDLRNWEKRGLMFSDEQWDAYFPVQDMPEVSRGWSKSGAILPYPINNRYWMFFGDTHLWLAHSDDLRSWEIVQEPVLSPRIGSFDSRLVEPGPPPMLTSEGIWLGYNAATEDLRYSFGQALFDKGNPTQLIARSAQPLLEPEHDSELKGQVDQVVFVEGLVDFQGRWFLYYGMADSRIGVAFAAK